MTSRQLRTILIVAFAVVAAIGVGREDASALAAAISSGECESAAGNLQDLDRSETEADQSVTRSLQPAQAEPDQSPAANPVRLEIPALDIDAVIEPVGVADNGNMGDPSEWDDVGWFEPGSRPGAMGNSVLAGHYDSPWGPAVFYQIDALTPGDEIVITMDDGSQLRFAVTETLIVSADEAPIQRIFGVSSGRNLNLITCYGVYDRQRGLYDDRLVVFSELIED